MRRTRSSVRLLVPVVVAVVALILPASAEAWDQIHIVQPGENLYRIALRYGVTVQAIVLANGLPDPDYIWVGQRLVIPIGGGGGGCAYTHVVQRGENLYRIALRYGVTVQAIVNANHLWNPDYIWAGQRLCIPSCCYYPPPCGFYYVVQAGDTLYSIARRYGTCVQALVAANGLCDPDYIWAGQRLYIPCGIDP